MQLIYLLLLLQNDFLDKAQSYGLPQTPGTLPVHLLADISTSQYLLDPQPFGFVRYVYSQVTSDAAPLEFDLANLSRRVAYSLAGKQRIQNTLDDIYKDFCYKQAVPALNAEASGQLQGMPLPHAFAQPLDEQQLSALRARCSTVQLEELQRVSGLLEALVQQVVQQASTPDHMTADNQASQALTPDASIKHSLTSLMGHDALADQQYRDNVPFAQSSPVVHLFSERGLQELCLAHLQAVLQFFKDLYNQQDYQFANVSPFLKAPLTADQADALMQQLSGGCAEEPANAEGLRELAAVLREAELLVISEQAGKGSTLHHVCALWGYEPEDFPLKAIGAELLCSQYVAVMKIMLQVTLLPHRYGCNCNAAQVQQAHFRCWPAAGLLHPCHHAKLVQICHLLVVMQRCM